MLRALFLFSACLLTFCRQPQTSNYLRDLDQQISNRYQILERLSAEDHSLDGVWRQIRAEHARLLLMSKDIENQGTFIASANKFFDSLRKKYPGTRSAHLHMTLKECEAFLKENELHILNQIIYEHHGTGLQLFSVREDL